MKTSSAKDKGRRLQNWVAKKISDLTGIPWGRDELISSRAMGQSGVDVPLLGEAVELVPYSIECKNQEKWNVIAWIKQAKANQKGNTDWLVVAKKNRMEPVIIMDAEAFFRLMEKIHDKQKVFQIKRRIEKTRKIRNEHKI